MYTGLDDVYEIHMYRMMNDETIPMDDLLNNSEYSWYPIKYNLGNNATEWIKWIFYTHYWKKSELQ